MRPPYSEVAPATDGFEPPEPVAENDTERGES